MAWLWTVEEQLESDACYCGQEDEVAISMEPDCGKKFTDEPDHSSPLLPVFLKVKNWQQLEVV